VSGQRAEQPRRALPFRVVPPPYSDQVRVRGGLKSRDVRIEAELCAADSCRTLDWPGRAHGRHRIRWRKSALRPTSGYRFAPYWRRKTTPSDHWPLRALVRQTKLGLRRRRNSRRLVSLNQRPRPAQTEAQTEYSRDGCWPFSRDGELRRSATAEGVDSKGDSSSDAGWALDQPDSV